MQIFYRSRSKLQVCNRVISLPNTTNFSVNLYNIRSLRSAFLSAKSLSSGIIISHTHSHSSIYAGILSTLSIQMEVNSIEKLREFVNLVDFVFGSYNLLRYSCFRLWFHFYIIIFTFCWFIFSISSFLQLISCAFQRCRVLDDFCRLSVSLKPTPPLVLMSGMYAHLFVVWITVIYESMEIVDSYKLLYFTSKVSHNPSPCHLNFEI